MEEEEEDEEEEEEDSVEEEGEGEGVEGGRALSLQVACATDDQPTRPHTQRRRIDIVRAMIAMVRFFPLTLFMFLASPEPSVYIRILTSLGQKRGESMCVSC